MLGELRASVRGFDAGWSSSVAVYLRTQALSRIVKAGG